MKNSKINGEWTTKELQNNKDWLINLDHLDKKNFLKLLSLQLNLIISV